MAVTANEFRWRAWVLGEGEYSQQGSRSKPRPNFGYGGPGQKKIPGSWWQRLEEFLARRDDHTEPDGPHLDKHPKKIPRAKPGQLTPHFHVSEFNCHNGAKVPAAAVPGLDRLCARFLEPLRAQFGNIQVLSGYRPKAYNASIGGARFSQHIYELTPGSVAADIVCARGRPRDWYRVLDRMGPGGLGLYDSFVHVDNRPGHARWPG